MPTYEFRCPDGTIIEKIFKISDAPDEIPSPNGDGMAKRIISGGAGLLFKGTGFYITDYGKDGKKDQRDATAKSSSSDAKSASSSSDAKSSGASSGSGTNSSTTGGTAGGKSGGSETKSSPAAPSSSSTSSSTPKD